MTPVIHQKYRIGLPTKGKLTQIFNSDAVEYGGNGTPNLKSVKTEKEPWNGREFSAELVLPPLGICVFKIG
jgi:1,4-alpha-glucan branching enzyme